MSDSKPALIPLYKHLRLVGYAIVDADDEALLLRGRWTLSRQGYAVTTTRDAFDGEHLMHRIVSLPHTDEVVDHINGNRLDNRKANLRNCTHAQNSANIALIRARSGYRGVNQDQRDKRWQASITVNRQRLSLGSYHTAEDAAHVYDAAARQLRGEFAVLNFPNVRLHDDVDWVAWADERRETVNGQRKLKLEEAREIRRRQANGERSTDLAREFRVSPGIISHIVAGRSYPEPPRPEVLAQAIARVQAGEAITAVAQELGVSRFILRKAVRDQLGEVPKVNQRRRRSNARLTQENVDEIRRRADDGEKQKDLAAEFGVSLATVNGYVRHRTKRVRTPKV